MHACACSILFLDEPTTGLDATTSSSVLALLKRLAEVRHLWDVLVFMSLPLALLKRLADGRHLWHVVVSVPAQTVVTHIHVNVRCMDSTFEYKQHTHTNVLTFIGRIMAQHVCFPYTQLHSHTSVLTPSGCSMAELSCSPSISRASRFLICLILWLSWAKDSLYTTGLQKRYALSDTHSRYSLLPDFSKQRANNALRACKRGMLCLIFTLDTLFCLTFPSKGLIMHYGPAKEVCCAWYSL